MYKVSDNVRSTHQPDGGTVLDIGHGRLFDLTLVGSRIFELLKEGFSQREIVDTIQREFKVSREVVETDLMCFCDELRQHGLIEPQTVEGKPAGRRP